MCSHNTKWEPCPSPNNPTYFNYSSSPYYLLPISLKVILICIYPNSAVWLPRKPWKMGAFLEYLIMLVSPNIPNPPNFSLHPGLGTKPIFFFFHICQENISHACSHFFLLFECTGSKSQEVSPYHQREIVLHLQVRNNNYPISISPKTCSIMQDNA